MIWCSVAGLWGGVGGPSGGSGQGEGKTNFFVSRSIWGRPDRFAVWNASNELHSMRDRRWQLAPVGYAIV